MENVKLIPLPLFQDQDYGSLVAIEAMQTIPFELERVYYIFGVPTKMSRGFHSHRELEQLLICVSGSVSVSLKSPYETSEIILNDNSIGLYIGPMIWREMADFSPDAVLLVLASKHFDEADYLRDFNAYLSAAKEYFGEEKG